MIHRRESWDAVKGIAIFSVIAAHLAVPIANQGDFDLVALAALEVFGLLGVPIFLFLSGHFGPRRTPNRTFWTVAKSRLVTVVVPWLLGSSFSYFAFYAMDRTQDISLLGWLAYVAGLGSIYYFVPVLLVLQLSCFFLPRVSKVALAIGTVVFLTSVTATSLGLLSVPYLNPLNWLFFYLLGLYARDNPEWMARLTSTASKSWLLEFVFVGALTATILIEGLEPGFSYFRLSAVAVETTAVLLVIKYADHILNLVPFLKDIGLASFSIYLFHLPFVHLINALYSKTSLPWVWGKFAIGILVVSFGVLVLRGTARRFPRLVALVGWRADTNVGSGQEKARGKT